MEVLDKCDLYFSSSSSDAGIRETTRSNLDPLSASTLNENGISLNSTPAVSEILNDKNPWISQTFINDSLDTTRSFGNRPDRKIKLNCFTFQSQIPSFTSENGLGYSNFKMEIIPIRACNLSVCTIPQQIDIPSKISSGVQNGDSRGRVLDDFRMKTERSASKMTKSLYRLEKKLSSLHNVFQEIHPEDSKNLVEKLTLHIDYMKTDANLVLSRFEDKVEALNLDCEFIWASGYLIRKYPFYYEFLEKYYRDSRSCCSDVGRLMPKQETFKKAVVCSSKLKKSRLRKINTYLRNYVCRPENEVE